MAQVEQHAPPKAPVLFVGERDSTRLLEAYVKRSLSLNDASRCTPRRERRTRKWVPSAERGRRVRKHSSDISLHLKPLCSEVKLREDEAFSEPEIDRKAQEDHERTDNKSKLLTKKSTPGRNYGSSASPLSDGKLQKWLVNVDVDTPDGKQPNTPTPAPTEEDPSKVYPDSVTESENFDKSKHCNKSSLTRRDASSASQSSDEKPRKCFLHIEKDKRNSQLHDSFKQDLEDIKISGSLLTPQPQLENLSDVKKTKDGKKTKKPSIWKSFLGLFSRENTDKQDDEDDEGRNEEALPTPEPATPTLSCLPISTADDIIQRHTKTTRRRRSQRRLSFKKRSRDMGLEKTSVRPVTLDLFSETNSQAQSIDTAEATSSYYEKMSEELKKIVYEVKNTPTEENRNLTDSVEPTDTEAESRSQEDIINRIIDLIKEEGDVINDKLNQNTVVTSFLNTITYGSFQKLADQYVNSEVHHQKTQPPVVAPELVKFAFTLDFTARVAALSRHAPGHILGFGNQYLKERFIYMCENHPYDIITEKPVTGNENSVRAER
ncbi:Apoptosis facilitator Bcl-2-like protein 14 [Bagarius yarrelli]|uniref:Apoptosis facilitator Bcl-2-like protein 14 n=1 Tax=Bagarius yarrelli TaxID=175774 RepID=A0A556VXY0_BAGYA|nr:Apoptosis facilitator Bcl-2-like protein 14 [Bagarius yarrelli]